MSVSQLHHSLIRAISADDGQVFGTGCNTDGQLGLGPDILNDVSELTKMELPREVVDDGGVAEIRAGADTSALITRGGSLWTWGNSVRHASRAFVSCNSCARDRRSTRKGSTAAGLIKFSGPRPSMTRSYLLVDG